MSSPSSSSSMPSSSNPSSVAKLKLTDFGTHVSPYYKGLIDPSLVISKQEYGSQNDLNTDYKSCFAKSPYCRGLLDQSLAISKQDGKQNHHHKRLSAVYSSPYYRGLTNLSLVHGKEFMRFMEDHVTGTTMMVMRPTRGEEGPSEESLSFSTWMVPPATTGENNPGVQVSLDNNYKKFLDEYDS